MIEAAVAVAAGVDVPEWVRDGFDRLPETMDRVNSRAAQIDRAAVDLAEAVTLAGREGEVFDAVVTDENQRGATIQLTGPAIVDWARLSGWRWETAPR